MGTVILVIHLLLAIALVLVVLMQRSEGGGLGMGGGGSGFMTGRATANLLSRTTGILAACFIATSLALALIANAGKGPKSVLDRPMPASSGPAVPIEPAPAGKAPATGTAPAQPQAPSTPSAPQAPAAPMAK